MCEVASWIQVLVAAIVALATGLGWVAWLGSWVGGVDARVATVERFVNGHDDKWNKELRTIDSRLSSLEVEDSRTDAHVEGLTKRAEVSESLLQSLTNLGPLIRDSNDLQRQRMTLDGNGYGKR
jgi:hypothetical protein